MALAMNFVVVDAVTQNAYFTPETIKRLADRHRGIGFDQLLIVEPPYDPDLDFHYRIFNADGSEVSQCGNGARCFARFVTLKGLTNKKGYCSKHAKRKNGFNGKRRWANSRQYGRADLGT